MTYIVTLTPDQMAENEDDWHLTQRFTKGLPTGLDTSDTGTRLAFLVRDNEPGRFITWMGSVQRFNTVGPVDRSITIEPMRRCPRPVPLDGPDGILASLTSTHRAQVERALSGSAGHCGTTTWQALQEALLRSHPELAPYIEWLLAHLSPVVAELDELEQEDQIGRLKGSGRASAGRTRVSSTASPRGS